jgi:hypothetical protein
MILKSKCGVENPRGKRCGKGMGFIQAEMSTPSKSSLTFKHSP